ncbi:MAG: PQQ-like beta-propeller repeat protein [Phycisphaerae bacterium]|nr:PQQ-like beta-propeller repeat protein [Phycisphaerae bacterium]
MRKTISIVSGFFLLIALVGCDTPAADTISRQVVHTNALTQAGLGVYWERQMPLIVAEQLRGAKLMGGSIVLFSNDRNLYCVDAGIGVDRWAMPVKVTNRNEPVYAPTFFPDLQITEKPGDINDILNPPDLSKIDPFDAILINTYTRFLVINNKTGRVVRDINFDTFSATNSGVTDGQRLYVAASSEDLVAFKILTSVKKWEKDIGEITVPVIVSDRRVFVGTTDGALSCYDAADSSMRLWKKTLNGQITSEFFVDDRGTFVATDEGYLNALDPDSGNSLWKALHIKGQPNGGMTVGDQTIFQPTTAGLYAVDLTTGQQRWVLKGGKAVLAVMGEIVYVLTNDKNMLLVNEVTGDVLFTVPMDIYDFCVVNVKVPGIYAVTADGRVTCIRQMDAPKLTPEMLK